MTWISGLPIAVAGGTRVVDLPNLATLLDRIAAGEVAASEVASAIREHALREIAGCNGGKGHMPELAAAALEATEQRPNEAEPMCSHGLPERAACAQCENFELHYMKLDPRMDKAVSEGWDRVKSALGLDFLHGPEDVILEIEQLRRAIVPQDDEPADDYRPMQAALAERRDVVAWLHACREEPGRALALALADEIDRGEHLGFGYAVARKPGLPTPGHTCNAHDGEAYDLRCVGCVSLRIATEGPVLEVGKRPANAVPDLEAAFWRFDALHKAHYRDADSALPGPMSERDAFKRVLAEVVDARGDVGGDRSGRLPGRDADDPRGGGEGGGTDGVREAQPRDGDARSTVDDAGRPNHGSPTGEERLGVAGAGRGPAALGDAEPVHGERPVEDWTCSCDALGRPADAPCLCRLSLRDLAHRVWSRPETARVEPLDEEDRHG